MKSTTFWGTWNGRILIQIQNHLTDKSSTFVDMCFLRKATCSPISTYFQIHLNKYYPKDNSKKLELAITFLQNTKVRLIFPWFAYVKELQMLLWVGEKNSCEGCGLHQGLSWQHFFFFRDSECPRDRYGEGCNQTCNCSKNSVCDPSTGICSCKPGYYGKNCTRGKYVWKWLTILVTLDWSQWKEL